MVFDKKANQLKMRKLPASTDKKTLAREFRIDKLTYEILTLTEQQAKHRQRVIDGTADKYIHRFIRTVGNMILVADRELSRLVEERRKENEAKTNEMHEV